jgi:4-alpha-glucanotransferase
MNFAEPMDPSPYLPVSRLFWNELYVDVAALPEVAASGPIRSMVEATHAERRRLSALPDADHAAVMRLKEPILDLAARSLTAQPSDRRDEFERFVKAHPELELYADFRAAAEPDDRRAATALRHRYAQFVTAEQLAAAGDHSAGLYLDLPVGVHRDGFDVAANPLLFGTAGVGAPPDPMAAEGQSWGFPPIHPERVRESGYRYVIDSYRTAMRYARAVRIDHVLGLQRLFWIPGGEGADAGAYVRYRGEETRAIIAIEAARSGTIVVGEDLGTVSPSIRHAMDRDGMLHTFVYQFEASAAEPDPQPSRPSMASLGGHDLPKFATFWPTFAGDDEVAGAYVERLMSLAEGPASYVSIDLGDLLGETVQDNRPGTGPEAGNWRHRLPRTLSEIADNKDVVALVSAVRSARDRTMVKGAGA